MIGINHIVATGCCLSFMFFPTVLPAGSFEWTGNAGNDKWSDAKNWNAVDSKYRFPTEERGKTINNGCDKIVIGSGAKVRCGNAALSIDGSLDGLKTPALIVENGGELTLHNVYLGDALGTRGQIGVGNAGTLVVKGKLDIGNDGFGRLCVSNGNLIAEKDLGVGSGKYASGAVTVSGRSKVLVKGNLILSEAASGKSRMTISDGDVTVLGALSLGGKYHSNDSTLCRVFLKGGVLRLGNLLFKKDLAAVVVSGGMLLVKTKAINKKKMLSLIKSGKIDVSELKNWTIIQKDDHTALGSKDLLASLK